MASEKRLIDSEQAKRATYEEVFWTESEQAVVRNFLAKLPRVDAVEVVHGHWKEWWSEEYITYFHKCSVCGRDALTKEETCHDEVLSNYCPNCGAKMDKNENP